MRIAAGIILIILGVFFGVWFLSPLIGSVAVYGIGIFKIIPELLPMAVILLFFFAPAAFYAAFNITGGIFCLRRKYWRVCLASASFGVFIGFLGIVELLLGRYSGASWIDWIIWVMWVMIVAAVIAVIFILRTKKEWQETSDSVDGKVSYGG